MVSFQANSSFPRAPGAIRGLPVGVECAAFPEAVIGDSKSLAANRRVRGSASDGKETVPVVSQLAPEDYPRYEQLRL